MSYAPVKPIGEETRECITACQECHAVCMETIPYWLERGGQHADAAHIRVMLDCAQICSVAADFMLRSSDLHLRLCALCEEVCEQCGRDCFRLKEDGRMRLCADVCRKCADACRRMAAATAA